MSLKGSPASSKLLICKYRKSELQCRWHQSRRHTSMFTMFGSSDRVLLTMVPAELQ